MGDPSDDVPALGAIEPDLAHAHAAARSVAIALLQEDVR